MLLGESLAVLLNHSHNILLTSNVTVSFSDQLSSFMAVSHTIQQL